MTTVNILGTFLSTIGVRLQAGKKIVIPASDIFWVLIIVYSFQNGFSRALAFMQICNNRKSEEGI